MDREHLKNVLKTVQKPTIRQVLYGACLGVGIVWLCSTQLIALLQFAKLVPIEEHYTELYFEGYESTQDPPAVGEEVLFDYSIRNHTGGAYAYPVETFLQSVEGTLTHISDQHVLLSEGEKRTFSETFTFEPDMVSGTVIVRLPELDHTIHFNLTTR